MYQKMPKEKIKMLKTTFYQSFCCLYFFPKLHTDGMTAVEIRSHHLGQILQWSLWRGPQKLSVCKHVQWRMHDNWGGHTNNPRPSLLDQTVSISCLNYFEVVLQTCQLHPPLCRWRLCGKGWPKMTGCCSCGIVAPHRHATGRPSMPTSRPQTSNWLPLAGFLN